MGKAHLVQDGIIPILTYDTNSFVKGNGSANIAQGQVLKTATYNFNDIIDALILIMEKEAFGYEFELGRGKNYSVNEVAQMFNIIPIYKESKQGEARITLNQDNTANKILNWNPQIDLLYYIQNNYNEKK